MYKKIPIRLTVHPFIAFCRPNRKPVISRMWLYMFFSSKQHLYSSFFVHLQPKTNNLLVLC